MSDSGYLRKLLWLLVLGVAFSCNTRRTAPPSSPPAAGAAARAPVAGELLAISPPQTEVFEARAKYRAAKDAPGAPPCPPVDAGKLYRFIEGTDRCMVEMSASEANAKLGDPFARSVLLEGERPSSVDQILEAMAPSKLEQASYLVGEGNQIPATASVSRDADRNLRYVVSWVDGSSAPGVFLSAAPGGHSSFLQLIGWDTEHAVFNFYERRAQVGGGNSQAWSWAGETSMASTQANHGVGCFDCHHNGVTIMKELSRPWNNWQSELAEVAPTNVPAAVAAEKLFMQRQGGERLESLIRSSYQAYYDTWLRANYTREATGQVQLTNTHLMLRRLTTNTTVNFAASQVQSRGHATSPPNAALSGIPSHLFLWDDLLRTSSLRLDYQFPPLTFERGDYDAYITKHEFKLVQKDAATPYSVPGSTWFSFFTPVPAAEDQYLLLQLLSAKVFTDKFVAAVLLVDFPNPVFSDKRSSLQKYGDQITSGTLKGSKSSVVDDFVSLVQAVAKEQPPCATEILTCSAEQQFLATWALPDASWRAQASKRVQAHLDEFVAKASLEQVMQLAQRRRDTFTRTPVIENLDEFSLLLPQNNLKE